jgi:hypothetical protein
LVAILVIAVILIFAPNVFAVGFGRLLADLWITVMGAVAGLLGGVLGG